MLLRGLCGHVALVGFFEALDRLPLALPVFIGKIHPLAAACCAHLAKAGGVVYNIDFKAPAADVPGVTHLQCDVSDVAQVKRAVGAVVKAHGRIDTLVSNAGVWHGGDFERTSERDFDKVVGVNLKGTFFGIQAAVPAMLDNGGSIVIIGSDQSLVGKPEQHLYGLSLIHI